MSIRPPTDTVRQALVAALLLVTALVYAPFLDHPFQYDDGHTIVDHAALHQPGAWRAALTGTSLSSAEVSGGHYRPLTHLSYWATIRTAGMTPRAFHAGNLLLHLLTIWLVIRLVTALTADARVGLASGALFALHPALSEAVLYASARSGLLATVFLLTALSLFVRARRRDNSGRPARLAWIGFALFATLALLAKETAIVLPVICIAADHLLLRLSLPMPARRRWAPYAVLAAGLGLYFVMTGLWHHATTLQGADLGRYLGVVAHQWLAVGMAVRLFVWPWPLSVDHVLPTWPAFDAILSLSLSVGLLGLGLLSLRIPSAGRRAAGFFALWVVIASLPTVLWPLNVPFQEHRAYGPDVGVAALAAIGLVRMSDTRLLRGSILAAGGVVLATLFSWQVIERGRLWEDPVRLWDDARRVTPASYRSHANAGLALATSGRWEEADFAFAAALARNPNYPPALIGQGVGAHRRGERGLAGERYRRALEVAPGYVPALYNLGLLAQQSGDLEEAERRYREALSINPLHRESLMNLRTLAAARGAADRGR